MYAQAALMHPTLPPQSQSESWFEIPGTQQRFQKLESHAPLFHEGDEAEFVYEVVEGVVCCYSMLANGRRQVLSFSFPGDLIGLAQGDLHRYSTEALCPARVRSIPKSLLLKTAAERPELGRKLLEFATSRLAVMQDHFVMLGRKSALEKVASFLLALAKSAGGEGSDSVTFNLPMTRADIADYLGLTLETVSRTLTKLKTAGAIDLPQPQKVVVRDLFELEELAESDVEIC